MLKPFVARRFEDALQLAVDAGVTQIHQIKRAVRRRGTWFITCELPA